MINKFLKNKNKLMGGFTLMELLVVISIFAMITGITIFNYGKFRNSLSIQNLADDIALTIRKAQGFAIGVRATGDDFIYGYGIHITANNGSDYEGSNKAFILFTDIGATPNRYYDYNNHDVCGDILQNECLEVLRIISDDEIKEITVNVNNHDIVLPSEGTVDLLFKRPNPEPTFCYSLDGVSENCTNAISSIKIKISNVPNPEEIYKIITIYNNGQINVSK